MTGDRTRGPAVPGPVRVRAAAGPRVPGPPRPPPPARPDRPRAPAGRSRALVTKDVIALTPKMPDTWALLAGLYAGGPGLTVDTGHDGAVVQLCDGGRPPARLPRSAAARAGARRGRAPPGRSSPLPRGPVLVDGGAGLHRAPEAERLAGSVAGRLTTLLGGTAWPPDAASTEVVPVAEDGEVTARPVSGGAAPDGGRPDRVDRGRHVRPAGHRADRLALAHPARHRREPPRPPDRDPARRAAQPSAAYGTDRRRPTAGWSRTPTAVTTTGSPGRCCAGRTARSRRPGTLRAGRSWPRRSARPRSPPSGS